MGRRTLTASTLTFHQKRKRNASSYAPADLEGEDLLKLFQDWANDLGVETSQDDRHQSWVSIANVRSVAPRVVLLDLRVGYYGEPGEIVDVTSGDTVGTILDDQAPTGANRALLFVPEQGATAYYLAEESSRGSAGARVLRLFKRYFSDYTDLITMTTQTVTESEAWSKGAKLKEVEVRLSGHSADIADGPQVEVGTISYVARPERRNVFPGRLLPQLHKKEVVGELVSVPDLPDGRDVYVTMERDGRTKKFILGSEGAPAVREVLNDASQPVLTDIELLETCSEKVSDMCSRNSDVWISDWSRLGKHGDE